MELQSPLREGRGGVQSTKVWRDNAREPGLRTKYSTKEGFMRDQVRESGISRKAKEQSRLQAES